MVIRAQLYCRKEKTRFDRRGHMYCWYYRVFDAETGNVLASDNTASWQKMMDAMLRDLAAIRHCARLGILKKSRGW
ncbi:hypothetical protein [Pseudarthrobacter sp. S6]|uniref:hypothetical protein n=1 Tax=Pseudarthrobacter sp. S6 TaxID=3418420 RepID=UPI003CF69DD7